MHILIRIEFHKPNYLSTQSPFLTNPTPQEFSDDKVGGFDELIFTGNSEQIKQTLKTAVKIEKVHNNHVLLKSNSYVNNTIMINEGSFNNNNYSIQYL